jgi:hypothetical protein
VFIVSLWAWKQNQPCITSAHACSFSWLSLAPSKHWTSRLTANANIHNLLPQHHTETFQAKIHQHGHHSRSFRHQLLLSYGYRHARLHRFGLCGLWHCSWYGCVKVLTLQLLTPGSFPRCGNPVCMECKRSVQPSVKCCYGWLRRPRHCRCCGGSLCCWCCWLGLPNVVVG